MFGGFYKQSARAYKRYVIKKFPSDSIEKYDIVTDSWTKLEVKLPTKYLYSLAHAEGDQVMILAAGEKNQGQSHLIEDYTW